jgi:hypothetical protein
MNWIKKTQLKKYISNNFTIYFETKNSNVKDRIYVKKHIKCPVMVRNMLLYLSSHVSLSVRTRVGVHVYYRASDNFENKPKRESTDVHILSLLLQA